MSEGRTSDAEAIVLSALRSVRTQLVRLQTSSAPVPPLGAPVPLRPTESDAMQQCSAALSALFAIARLHPELFRAPLLTEVLVSSDSHCRLLSLMFSVHREF